MSRLTCILIIDDELGAEGSPHHRAFLRSHNSLPYQFCFATGCLGGSYSVDAAVAAVLARPEADLVLLDLCFGKMDDRLGLEILRELGRRFPGLPILINSSVIRDVASLGRCLEEGALGFVEKTAASSVLQATVERTLEMARSHVLVGQSPSLRELRRQAARLSPYDHIPVLIVGARGTGKERVARYIHHNGPRTNQPFVAVNCAAIPETLMESEFFGAEQGSYTGATSRRIGFFERARGGLLFLDEIGDMPLTTQAKLLRVLQDGSYRRVGSSEKEELKADVQLVCATNVAPEELFAKGRLREDFYDRIAAVTVNTPSLAQCRDDIPELARHFLRQLGLDREKRISRAAMDMLSLFDWPGNVRQLQRAIQEAVVRSEDSNEIQVGHLPSLIRHGSVLPQKSSVTDIGTDGMDNPSQWPRCRLLAEIDLALRAKQRVQTYKGKQWKAEFMRLMYPHCKAANAKGFDDLIKRLTQGPWGEPDSDKDSEVQHKIAELRS